jgi:hypothetical protein
MSEKVRQKQLAHWVEVRKSQHARELLRILEDDLRERARHGDTLAKYVVDRLDEVL